MFTMNVVVLIQRRLIPCYLLTFKNGRILRVFLSKLLTHFLFLPSRITCPSQFKLYFHTRLNDIELEVIHTLIWGNNSDIEDGDTELWKIIQNWNLLSRATVELHFVLMKTTFASLWTLSLIFGTVRYLVHSYKLRVCVVVFERHFVFIKMNGHLSFLLDPVASGLLI